MALASWPWRPRQLHSCQLGPRSRTAGRPDGDGEAGGAGLAGGGSGTADGRTRRQEAGGDRARSRGAEVAGTARARARGMRPLGDGARPLLARRSSLGVGRDRGWLGLSGDFSLGWAVEPRRPESRPEGKKSIWTENSARNGGRNWTTPQRTSLRVRLQSFYLAGEELRDGRQHHRGGLLRGRRLVLENASLVIFARKKKLQVGKHRSNSQIVAFKLEGARFRTTGREEKGWEYLGSARRRRRARRRPRHLA